jgi:hypothetical protein
MPKSLWHRMVEALMPWYDAEKEAERDRHTEAIRQRSIGARQNAEVIRAAYEKAGARVTRR